MKILRNLSALILVFCLSVQAQAWLLIEPMIGYNRGQNQTSRVQGIGFGARVGLEIGSLFIAGDAGYHDLQQGSLTSVKYTDVGGVIGGSLKGFRLWYGLITSSNYKYRSGSADYSYKGSGSKFGVGVSLGQNLFLNFDFRSLDYTEMNPGTGVVTPINEIASIGLLGLSWVF